MFGLYFRSQAPTSFAEVMESDRDRFNAFFHGMLERGVYLAPSAFEAGFVSASHDGEEIEATLRAAREAMEALAR
jgi:glutamate-1-semialdehyde 2,1-aminomutase